MSSFYASSVTRDKISLLSGEIAMKLATSIHHTGPDYPLCRLYHGRGPPSQGGPRRSAAKILPQCFDVSTFSVCLNITTNKKKVVNFFGKKVHRHRQENPGFAYKKRVPTLRWYGAPRMVNPALSSQIRGQRSRS